MRELRTEVLIVGAGPVGLWAALLLAKAGVETTIIDRENRTAARSYACALHPHTLDLLDSCGLADRLVASGRKIPKTIFYQGNTAHGSVDLSRLPAKHPYLLILAQSDFEAALEEALREAGVKVLWNHRFNSFQTDGEEVSSRVELLAGTSTGYIVPHWEMTVQQELEIRSPFLIGADGYHSTVAQCAGIEPERIGERDVFVAFEFQSDGPGADEIRIAMDDKTVNVLWPLVDNCFRWTFQLSRGGAEVTFPEKERRAVRLAQKAVDERTRQQVLKVAATRAPWFSAQVREVNWCTEVAFEHRVAKTFGAGRCWLAGDASHQTGPAGVQSMNAAFLEASELASGIKSILRDPAASPTLEAHNRQWQANWRKMLGISAELRAKPDTNAWVREHRTRILPCLPGTIAGLPALAAQLGLDFG